MNRMLKRNQRGFALLIAMLALLVVSALAIGLIYSSDVETAINYNYRHSKLAFFAARAGLEEVRERMSPVNPSPITLPTVVPGAAGSIIYVRNPNGASDTITPTDPANAYFDSELCQDNFVGLGLTNPGSNVLCSTGAPTSAVTYVSSTSPFTNTSSALDYKWVRITLKANNTSAPYYVNGSNAAGTLNTQACFGGTNEALVPTGFTTCSDAGLPPVYVLTSLAVTSSGGRHMSRYEVAPNTVIPSGAINVEAPNSSPAFNNGFPGGTGDRIPPTAIDGRAYDINGNLVSGGGCPAVSTFATDTTPATTQIDGALDSLRQNIVTRANNFCNANGSNNGGDTCTPGLWWVRGTNASPRFSDTSGSCSVSSSTCYKNLNLAAPELNAVSAVTAPNIPTVTLPTPASAPFAGAPGNAPDPTVTQITTSALQQQVQSINSAISVAQTSGQAITIAGGTLSGGTYTYGSATQPKVVIVSASGGLELQGGLTMTGYGILVINNEFRIDNANFNWTGIVYVKAPSGNFRLDTGSTGSINGALYLQSPTGAPDIRTSDSDSNAFRISYSCAAVALAMSPLPVQIISTSQLSY